MKQGRIMKAAAFMCAVALCCLMFAGCTTSSATTAATEEQQANRAYMAQVNDIMDQLDESLDTFVDAVSRGDIVNMRTQASNAYQVLDKLDSLEAPEALSDIQDKYKDGTDKLRQALDKYIDLYADAESSSFDWDDYDKRIAEIQGLYDEGVKALQEGDEAAASKN